MNKYEVKFQFVTEEVFEVQASTKEIAYELIQEAVKDQIRYFVNSGIVPTYRDELVLVSLTDRTQHADICDIVTLDLKDNP